MVADDIDSMERGQGRRCSDINVGDEKHRDFEPSHPSPASTAVESPGDSRDSPSTISRWSSHIKGFVSRSWQRKEVDEECLPVVRRFQDCPDGYPTLAAFLDSDENFMLYRRFGFIQSRLLLYKQDQLRVLEEELDTLDKNDDDIYLTCRANDDLDERPRTKLLKKIEAKFREYAELLAIAQNLATLNKPAKRDYKSVRTYFENEQPVCDSEQYIRYKEDIITLKPGRENAWLDATVEKGLQKFACPPIRYLFCSPETRAKADENTILYDKGRIDALVTMIITAMILALLIIPIYVLWHLSNEVQDTTTTAVTIGVLLVFTLVFSAVLSLFTRARRHEILGAAAAYCAVLVVFISNVGPSGNGVSAGY
ncbi:hypothetical protein BP6252_06017 [Coleophoma cylindrospora]|uniref:DUF6594 domain-containing protein n=1 Tax=Coleophoma cylindrospora TaxID=1849047 RepID=A0A3D8RLE8_9HELO|nr:hypothetical protein BP6252_06017 [Coleophoma cylindrospora]